MSWPRRRLLAVMGLAATALGGCTNRQIQTPSGPSGPPPQFPSTATYAYTHLQASGNRVLQGRGAVDEVTPVDIEIEGRPKWLLAAGETDSYWTVVTADETATTHRVSDGTSEQVADHGSVSMPPLGYRSGGSTEVVDAPDDCADHSHPVVLDDGLLYVASDGAIVIWRDDEPTRLDVQVQSTLVSSGSTRGRMRSTAGGLIATAMARSATPSRPVVW